MKIGRFKLTALLLGATLLSASCGEPAPTSPVASTPHVDADLTSLLGNTLQALGLLKCTPMAYAWDQQTIGPSGGSLHIGPHTFTVPAGALDHQVTITGVSPSDNVNRIEFQPQGLQFDRSASLTMSYSNCNLLGKLLPKHIAYTDDNLRILYLLPSIDDLLSKKVTAPVDHFSEYAAAW